MACVPLLLSLAAMWVIGAAEMAPPAAPHGRNVRLNNLTDIWGQNWTDLCGMKAGKLISGVRSPQLVKTPSTLLLCLPGQRELDR